MLTIDEFKTIMREVAGNDPEIDSSIEAEDSLLTDLGYDSLALLEIAAVVQQRYGLSVPERSQCSPVLSSRTRRFYNTCK